MFAPFYIFSKCFSLWISVQTVFLSEGSLEMLSTLTSFTVSHLTTPWISRIISPNIHYLWSCESTLLVYNLLQTRNCNFFVFLLPVVYCVQYACVMCTTCSMWCTVCSIQCTVCSVWCVQCKVCVVFSVGCAMWSSFQLIAFIFKSTNMEICNLLKANISYFMLDIWWYKDE